jgi:hypothetical protein
MVSENISNNSTLFNAGNTKNCLKNWQEITNDPWVLNAVSNFKIPLENIPEQRFWHPTGFSKQDSILINKEIEKLQYTGVIEKCEHSPEEIISNIFIRSKKSGGVRIILNLKNFNQFVPYQHFKMESLSSALKLITPGCYMASLDLENAYFSIPIHEEHRKYLRFIWGGQLFQFCALPNGLACAPFAFTKITKPIMATLRNYGHISVIYIDDTLLIGEDVQSCIKNVQDSSKLFQSCGFKINTEKSIIEPKTEIEFLGFVINSSNMTISLTESKALKIKNLADELLVNKECTIRKLAEFIGNCVAAFPSVTYGKMHYRHLERLKSRALKSTLGNYDHKVVLSDLAQSEIIWWHKNILNCSAPINHSSPQYILKTDASKKGWGAVRNDKRTGGHWSQNETNDHINVLELKAALFGLQSLCQDLNNKHILIKLDNKTAVCYINDMGGTRSVDCDKVAKDIWVWCKSKDIWLSATYLEGRLNTEADTESRKFKCELEWSLQQEVFNSICEILGNPKIDLFASRINRKLNTYVAWRPDPHAQYIDAFTINWSKDYFYAFPPFSLIARVLQKTQIDAATGILILPKWTTAVWYPTLLRMLIAPPLILPKMKRLLFLPQQPELIHPLYPKLTLIACKISGLQKNTQDFHNSFPNCSSMHGKKELKNNIQDISRNGKYSVTNNKLISFHRL